MQYVFASLANVLITIGATVLLVVVFDKGPVGVLVGSFIGTLIVYAVLVGYHREQLGLVFDRGAVPQDEPLRDAARALRARALGDQLHRPLVRGLLQGPERGRRLLGRGADRLGGDLPPARVPHRLAGVRLLDHRRPRREARVRLRAHLRPARHLLALGRARAARALARAPAGAQPRLPARLRGGRAARLLRGRLRRLHRARDRLGARAPDAAELGDLRARRRGEHRPERAPDPALRDDRRGDLDARRLRRALPRDALVRAGRCTRSPTSGDAW